MTLPNRTYSSPVYRYGFQGQEKDDEIKGEGNSLNYTFKMHDPRVGRFFATAPLAPKYPHNSPYAFSENRVIDGFELEGLEFLDADESRIKLSYGAAMINLNNVFGATYNMLHEDVYDQNGKYLWRRPNQDLIYLGRYIYQGTEVESNSDIKLYTKNYETTLIHQDDLIGKDKTINHANKYNKKRPVSLSVNPLGTKRGGAAVAIVETVNFSLQKLKNYLVTKDIDLLTEHSITLRDKVLPAIQKALASKTKTYIPENLRDVQSLSLIANVVLFGGDGSEKYTQEIIDAGMNIYYELTPEGQKEKNILDKQIQRKSVPIINETAVDNTSVSTPIVKEKIKK